MLARRLRNLIHTFKIGSRLFTAEGPAAVKRLAPLALSVFLDLKFHDIPNTVSEAVASAARLPKVRLLTLHAAGGFQMMRAAREAISGLRNPPKLFGVTVLTSLRQADLRKVGIPGAPVKVAVGLAKLAQQAGLDGVVTSAQEAAAIRQACGPRFLILVPAVRPEWAETNDQARVGKPADAIHAGANYLVAGRPITAAKDPRAAAVRILSEIAGALRR